MKLADETISEGSKNLRVKINTALTHEVNAMTLTVCKKKKLFGPQMYAPMFIQLW